MFLPILSMFLLLLACNKLKKYDNKNGVIIRVETLDSIESRFFSKLDCQFDTDIAIRKIVISNYLYDTLSIWCLNYCQENYPFILYDALNEYSGDSLITTDWINPPDGYPIRVIKDKPKTVYNRSKILKKNSKFRYTFWAEADSLGIKKNIELYFFEAN